MFQCHADISSVLRYYFQVFQKLSNRIQESLVQNPLSIEYVFQVFLITGFDQEDKPQRRLPRSCRERAEQPGWSRAGHRERDALLRGVE